MIKYRIHKRFVGDGTPTNRIHLESKPWALRCPSGQYYTCHSHSEAAAYLAKELEDWHDAVVRCQNLHQQLASPHEPHPL